MRAVGRDKGTAAAWGTAALIEARGEKGLETGMKAQLVAFDVLSNTMRVLVPPMWISSTCMPFRRTAVR